MKKEYRIIFWLLVFTFLFLLFKKPVEYFLNYIHYNEIKNDLIADCISRIFLFIFILGAIKKLDLFTNLTFYRLRIEDPLALLVPLILIASVIYSKFDFYNSVSIDVLLLFFTYCLLTGFIEEFLFRGIIFPLFIKANITKKNVIYSSMFYSSMLFGLMHYMNFISEPMFDLVTSQVIFAFCIGCCFVGILLRVGSIFPMGIVHGLFNFGFGASDLELNTSVPEANPETTWVSLIFTFVIWALLFLIGFLMAKASKSKFNLEQFNNIKFGNDEG